MLSHEAHALMVAAIVAVLRQACPSVDSQAHCAYRGDGNTKCVVGHAIPDDKYDELMDAGGGIVVTAILEEFPDALPKAIRLPFELSRLQGWHDLLYRGVPAGGVSAWRATAIEVLPDFIDKDAVRAACEQQGIEVAPSCSAP